LRMKKLRMKKLRMYKLTIELHATDGKSGCY
jgi:hypothetical protein